MLISAASSIVIARLLGPDGYGVYSLVLSLPAVFGPLLSLGIGHAVTYYASSLVASGRGSVAVLYVRNALLLEATLGLAASLAVVVFADAVARYVLARPDVSSLVSVASVLITTSLVIGVCDGFFLAMLRTDYGALIKVSQAASKLALAVPLVLWIGVFGAVLEHVASYVVAAALALALLIKLFRALGGDYAGGVGFVESLRSMALYSYPLYVPMLVSFVVDRALFTYTAHFVSDYDLGNY
ncbi:Conserved membrane protein, Mvin family [Thermoproteus tenax Kra 1]|uniref:Conserved membrane protein, Mvin family n=2 Tax=Thermoproteus tenax TaxID=2271 RepID=G4RK95_THETK|nr:Conserved membrane protein, Mvin family [Thermoproteus tenax Kra 1]